MAVLADHFKESTSVIRQDRFLGLFRCEAAFKAIRSKVVLKVFGVPNLQDKIDLILDSLI